MSRTLFVRAITGRGARGCFALVALVFSPACEQPAKQPITAAIDGGTLDGGAGSLDASAVVSLRPKNVDFNFLDEIDAGDSGADAGGGRGGMDGAAGQPGGDAGVAGTGGTVTEGPPEVLVLRAYADLLADWPLARIANVAGDAREDVLVREPAGRIVVYTREKNGFAAARPIGGAIDPSWQLVGAGHFDGSTPQAQVMIERPGGLFAIWDVNNGAFVRTRLSVMHAEAGWTFAAAADTNDDQEADIIWRNSDGRTAIWLMKDGAVTSTNILGSAGAEWSLVATADLDSDRRQDIVWINNRTRRGATWLLAGGDVKSTKEFTPALDQRRPIAAADLDGDARLDLAMRDGEAGGIELWKLDRITAASVTALFSDLPADWRPLPPLDIDGDGAPELVWSRTNGAAAAWIIKGGKVARQIFVRPRQRTASSPDYGACTCQPR